VEGLAKVIEAARKFQDVDQKEVASENLCLLEMRYLVLSLGFSS
jgi:hypothetical protein